MYNSTFMSDNKKFDLSYLEEISGGDQSFVNDIINDIVNGTPDIISRMDELSKANKWDDLYLLLHQFISSMAYVGLKETLSKLETIEYFVKNKIHINQIQALVIDVIVDLQLLVEQLKSQFKLSQNP